MPTIIEITPTTRRVKVTQTKITDDGKIDTETILQPGAPPRQFQAHRLLSIKVEELDADRTEAL